MPADPHRRPPLGLALATIGLGVALWYGHDWYRTPTMTDEQVAELVELNLAAAMARRPGAAQPTEQQLGALAATIREEIRTGLARKRETARTGCLAGLAAAVFGFVQMFLLRGRPP